MNMTDNMNENVNELIPILLHKPNADINNENSKRV